MPPFLTFLRDNARWLAAGALMSFLSSFGQTFFISIFAGEIRAEFGLGHAEWGAIYATGTAASAALMLWAGGLADRFRVATLGAAVLAGIAIAAAFMAFNSAAALLPAVIFCLRFTGQGMASHVAMVAMARWFVATRGRALAVATLGFLLGEATMPLTFVWLKARIDWQMLWALSAMFVLAMIPLLWRLLRTERVPQSRGGATQQPGMAGRHWRRAEALRHPLFWALMPALVGSPACVTAFWFQQVHFAAVKGWDLLALVAVFPLGSAAFLVATAGFGWAIDRFGAGRVLPVYLVPLALGFAVLGLTGTLAGAAAGVMLLGLAGGGQATLPAACWAEFYGTRHLGAIKAAVASAMVAGSAIGPAMSGALIDAGLAMPVQLLAYAAWFLGAGLVMLAPLARAWAARSV